MKTFPRLLKELPKKVTDKGLSPILDSYIKISKRNLPYFNQLSIDESMRLVLSTWFSNNGMEESSDDLMTTDKIYLMVVLKESDEVGNKTCEECEGDGKTACEYCNSGSNICDECGGGNKIFCPTCDGDGVDDEGEECKECNGDGEDYCSFCDDGYIECEYCDGDGENECDQCETEGIIEVEGSIHYDYYVYILTRMTQVKEIENSFMVENKLPLPYLISNNITIDEIEDFNTPYKIFYMSDISLENFGSYLLESPFKKYVRVGPHSLALFIRRLNNFISDEHYE
jgi:hypothetical protein